MTLDRGCFSIFLPKATMNKEQGVEPPKDANADTIFGMSSSAEMLEEQLQTTSERNLTK